MLVAVLALHVWASARVIHNPDSSRAQKVGQLALVWGIPILGAILVLAILRDDRNPVRRPPEEPPPEEDFGGFHRSRREREGTRPDGTPSQDAHGSTGDTSAD